ncbi:hypothetical protein [Nonomuraea basaltis]|uniref:hypothetical protein n=1 Tax=Nonomuraea basaltis TaxID=2495887 RepID=UPI001982416A|nr:hypothetical protein [Nonomuraea basaltis]
MLTLVTAINLRGIAHSARTFIAPTAIYVAAILLVIVVGLVRSEPAVCIGAEPFVAGQAFIAPTAGAHVQELASIACRLRVRLTAKAQAGTSARA